MGPFLKKVILFLGNPSGTFSKPLALFRESWSNFFPTHACLSLSFRIFKEMLAIIFFLDRGLWRNTISDSGGVGTKSFLWRLLAIYPSSPPRISLSLSKNRRSNLLLVKQNSTTGGEMEGKASCFLSQRPSLPTSKRLSLPAMWVDYGQRMSMLKSWDFFL